MNRTDKLRILQAAFGGQDATLRQLQHERQKNQMPYREAIGIVDVYHCDPLLLSLPVHPSRDSVDTGKMSKAIPVSEYLEELGQAGSHAVYDVGTAYGFLDPSDSQVDPALLHCIWLRLPDFSNRYVPAKRVSELREVFAQSMESLDKQPLVALIFECDPTRLKRF